MARQASVLVADEIYYNLSGKAILHGIYHREMKILQDPSTTHQLIFYFMAEADSTDLFESLVAEVTFPGSPAIRENVGLISPEITEDVSCLERALYRHALLVQMPTLRPGRIEVKMVRGAKVMVARPTV